MNILFQMFLNLKVIKQSLCCYRTCNSCACSGSSHFEVLRHIGNILEKISIYLSLVCHHWALRWAVLLGKGGEDTQDSARRWQAIAFPFHFASRLAFFKEEKKQCPASWPGSWYLHQQLRTSAFKHLLSGPLYLPSLGVTVVSSIDDTPWLPCLKEFPFTLAPQLYKVAGPGYYSILSVQCASFLPCQ